MRDSSVLNDQRDRNSSARSLLDRKDGRKGTILFRVKPRNFLPPFIGTESVGVFSMSCSLEIDFSARRSLSLCVSGYEDETRCSGSGRDTGELLP